MLSRIGGCLGRPGIPGTELHISENNPKGEGEYLTAKRLDFGGRLVQIPVPPLSGGVALKWASVLHL